MIQTPGEMEAAMIENLQAKTGNNLEEWMEIIANVDVEKKTTKIGNFLKHQFGVPHGISYVLAQIYLNNGKPVYGNPQALLDQQYKGQKQLLETYHQFKLLINKQIDSTIKFGVCKGYVSLLAKNQFGMILPKKNKIQLGLSLPGVEVNSPFTYPTGILKTNEKITHQFEMATIKDFNNDVLLLTKLAFDKYN